MAESSLKKIHIDCGAYLLRNVQVADASDRWGRWLADPEASHMLNVPPVTMSRQQIEDYIREFDQRTHLLIGIFEKASDKLIGFIRVDIDEANRRYLTSSFIGEPEYRDKGILQAVGVPLGFYFLEELGMQTCLTTVLSHNERVLHYLRKTGWHFDGVAPGHAKTPDGKPLDLYYFSYTREMWEAAKKRAAAEREAASTQGKEEAKARR